MEWSPLIGTVLGAAIGISATLATDQARWRRGRRDADLAVKRETYAEYLAALALTRQELHLAALSASRPLAQRTELAAKSFSTGRAYELRYQVSLIGPEEVKSASDQAFRALRRLRDLVQDGGVRGDTTYIEQRDAWEDALASLMARMKEDLTAT
jgi:hypothetical protein